MKPQTDILQSCRQATGNLRAVLPLPGIGSVAGFSGRRQDSEAFFKFTSFTEPGAIYRCGQLQENRIYVCRAP